MRLRGALSLGAIGGAAMAGEMPANTDVVL